MSKTLYIGIDPGVTGAVAVIDPPATIRVVKDMPLETMTTKSRKQNRISALGLSDLFCQLTELAVDNGASLFAVVEQVNPIGGRGNMGRGDSAATAFSMGFSYATILAALQLHEIRLTTVVPAVWKKHFSLTGCDKDASRTKARQLFPRDAAEYLSRKKDHNRAEALLLALYGSLKWS